MMCQEDAPHQSPNSVKQMNGPCSGNRAAKDLTRLEPGDSQHNGLAIHRWVLNCYENFLLYSSFQQVTNQSI